MAVERLLDNNRYIDLCGFRHYQQHPVRTGSLSHLTLDPGTGYFRKSPVWDTAMDLHRSIPDDQDMLSSIQQRLFRITRLIVSRLILSLRFGVPMFVLFFLTNVAAFFPSQRNFKGTGDVHMDRRLAHSRSFFRCSVFAGLPGSIFWKFMLMFWGLCLGIRASLRELTIETEIGSIVRNHQKVFASAMVN